jgi:hypothetical protein
MSKPESNQEPRVRNKLTMNSAALVAVMALVGLTVAPAAVYGSGDSQPSLTDVDSVEVGYFLSGGDKSGAVIGGAAGTVGGCTAGGLAAAPFGGVSAVGGCGAGASVGFSVGTA